MNTCKHHGTPDIHEILTALEKPLAFAAQNNFAALHTVKGLDTLIPQLADKALAAQPPQELQTLLYTLKEQFATFPSLSRHEQEQLIEQTLLSLRTIRATFASDNSLSQYETLATSLHTPIRYVKGIGPKTAPLLERMGITTVEDMLYYLPRTYIDRRRVVTIASLKPNMDALIIGTIIKSGLSSTTSRRKIFEIVVTDGTGRLSAKWFHLNAGHRAVLEKQFPEGRTVLLAGTVSAFRFSLEMHHPEIEPYDEDDAIEKKLMIIPVYPLTEGIHQKTIQKLARTTVMTYAPSLPDYLPEQIRIKHRLLPLNRSFLGVHLPDPGDDMDALLQMSSPYHRRIVFDEFFLLQLMLAIKKRGVALEPGIAFHIPRDKISSFISRLPFTLTAAQQRALSEILADMARPAPMHRLLQGDVGSGKTVVCLIAALAAIWNGYQSAIMAPTEILAEQHYATICELTRSLPCNIALLTGSMPKSSRDGLLERLRIGDMHLVVGTHALIQEGVEFKRLGFVVIDEQHRFGVLQRAQLKKKGTNPDVLVMTATPIPRTLGMTVYGDLDLSVIDELPPGRKPVITKVFHENRRQDAYNLVRRELANNNQAFIVYPLVEESDKLNLMDATRMAAHLQQDVFPEYRIGLVHGKMPQAEKDAIMREFKRGMIHILVATTVIEVGIDVPTASLMIIEHAERFGLAQLHQLRGRVGRGASQAWCILLAQYKKSDEARQRLAVMEQTNDGFKIAEEDFRIRGPGDFLGTRQSGIPDFRVAHIGRDAKILAEARAAAFTLIEQDPELTLPEHRLLRRILLDRWKGRLELASIG
ncbi:MAG: ATP-dependent DNA helicase RecG [Desulfobacterota bacterium]|nr:ATP-dependent DNA helicase RecG [Thermodesulfobacteriota bacterium]